MPNLDATSFSEKLMTAQRGSALVLDPGINGEQSDEYLAQVDSLLTFKKDKGITVRSFPGTPAKMSEFANKISLDFKEALFKGQVSLARMDTGEIKPCAGPVWPTPVPKSYYWGAVGGGGISIKFYWWGVRIQFSHAVFAGLTGTATDVAETLRKWLPDFIADAIIGVLDKIKAHDKGRGVYVYVTWALVIWFVSI